MSEGGKGKIHEHPKAGSNGFDKNPQNINRSGRRNSLSTLLRKKLFDNDLYVNFEGAELLDSEGKPTRQKVSVRIRLNSADAIMTHYVNRAMESDTILRDMMDRIDGKPSTVNPNDIPPDVGDDYLEERAKRFLERAEESEEQRRIKNEKNNQ